jgi:hypothetical protein
MTQEETPLGAIQQEIYELAQRHLLGANEELLGLHREGGLTYEQYSQVANLVVEAEQLLRALVRGKETPTADSQTLPIPFWLFLDRGLSPLAKWTYTHLLKVRRECCKPGRNALVINIDLVGRDIFPTYAWTQKHLLDAIRELTSAGVIASRKMDYPASTPEHWEIDFVREERL